MTNRRKKAFFQRQKRNLKGMKRRFGYWIRSLVRSLSSSKIVRTIIVLLLLLSILGVLSFFLLGERFDISEISIQGNSFLTKQFFEDELNHLKGKNIFLTRASGVDEDINELSPFVKDVIVEKKLPNKLNITIRERKPAFVLVTLSGAFLVDEEGVIVDVLKEFKPLEITDEDIDILMGYGNLEEQKSKSKKDKKKKVLGKKERKELLAKKKKELESLVKRFWTENTKSLLDEYEDYSLIYSYKRRSFTNTEHVEDSIMKNSLEVVRSNFIPGKEVIKYIWESPFRFVVYLMEGRSIIFSSRRGIEEQLKDLKALILRLKRQGKEFKKIDLGSDFIVYELI